MSPEGPRPPPRPRPLQRAKRSCPEHTDIVAPGGERFAANWPRHQSFHRKSGPKDDIGQHVEQRPPRHRRFALALVTAIATPTVAKGHRPAQAPVTAEGSDSDYYTNVSGHRVHRPVAAASAPIGATAQCRDGTYSFSEHARGTCSHHRGVARWIGR
ncbi:MAG: DUF3761 domain-containing protein [Caulobacteraceae bacterium]